MRVRAFLLSLLVALALAPAPVAANEDLPAGHIGIDQDLGPGIPRGINSRGEQSMVVGSGWMWKAGERSALPAGFAAEAVNNREEIVGSVGPPPRVAAVLRRGGITELEGLGGPSGANDVNNRGDIVGWVTDEAGKQHAAHWRGGRLTLLPSGDLGATAHAVNKDGDIVGALKMPPELGDQRAVMWRDGQLIDLTKPLPEWVWSSVAYGIGDGGHIVGSLWLEGYGEQFPLYMPGPEGPLGFAGRCGFAHFPVAVDRQGRAVGWSHEEGLFCGTTTAFAGGFRLVGYPSLRSGSLILSEDAATGINEHGMVVGWAWNFEDRPHERRAVLWRLP